MLPLMPGLAAQQLVLKLETLGWKWVASGGTFAEYLLDKLHQGRLPMSWRYRQLDNGLRLWRYHRR